MYNKKEMISEIPDGEASGKEGIDYFSHFLSLSSDNEFIPLVCLGDGERIQTNSKINFCYSLKIKRFPTSTRRLPRFCEQLSSYTTTAIGLDKIGIERGYFNSYGITYYYNEKDEIITPLMALCVRNSRLFKLEKVPNPDDISLLVANEFITNPEHLKVYRNVNKLYIKDLEDQIDIICTNNLTDRCFKAPEIQMPQFKTISDKIKHLQDLNRVLVSDESIDTRLSVEF